MTDYHPELVAPTTTLARASENSGARGSTPATAGRLLDIASTLFWKKGYAATSTREIASAAGIQQASLYHHVANKEELLYKICSAALQHFLARMELETKGLAAKGLATKGLNDPLDRIRALIRAHVTTLLTHQSWNVTMLMELRSLSRHHRAQVVSLRESYGRSVRSTFEEAQDAGLIRGDLPAKYLCLAFFDLLNWTALWFRAGKDLEPEQLAEVLGKIYVEGVSTRAGHRGASERKPPEGTGMKRSGSRRTLTPSDNPTLERLVAAAVTLFSRKGYAETTTREVAAFLGIQKASLYYHIESKEDLLYIICKSSSERIRADVAAAIRDVADPLERLDALIGEHMISMLRDDTHHSTTLAGMRLLSPDRQAEVIALRYSYEELVHGVIVAAQQAGDVRSDIRSRYLCLGLLGMMNRALVWYKHSGPLAPEQLSQVLAAVYLSGILPPRQAL